MEELNWADRRSEMDIASMLLGILNISGKLTTEGKSMPIRESYSQQVTGAQAGPGAMAGR